MFYDEKVYVAFSSDSRDREAICYVASKEPLLGKNIQEIMINTVEKRINKTRTPKQLEWLTDKGSIYRIETN